MATTGSKSTQSAVDTTDLEKQLADAGLESDPAAVREILAGLAAAPLSLDPTESLGLAVEARTETLDQFLLDCRKTIADRFEAALLETGASADRLAQLRDTLAARNLTGFVVPLTDEHHNEYVALRAQRLAWLTGFTGSAGLAAVLRDNAAMFVDGRYTLQVQDQVDGSLYDIRHMIDEPLEEWLADHLKAGDKLGFDPLLHTPGSVRKLETVCEDAGAELVPCTDNPVDAVWTDQPPPPISPIVPHGDRFAGESSAKKRGDIAASLTDRNIDTVVISAPDSIAWLLNVRGGDVENTPLPLSFALLHANGEVDWFVDTRKLTAPVRQHVGNAVSIHEPDALESELKALGGNERTVQLDETTMGVWFFDTLEQAGARIIKAPDPCALPKARKNDVEQAGTRAAHVRDGAALTNFLAWLSGQTDSTDLDEISAAAKLQQFREADPSFKGPSFTTISGAGANGAIVHYRVDDESNKAIQAPMLYLVDSGGQYPDGTTDVTRTVAFGVPTQAQREHFTRVLKGHIALARAIFPEGTKGSQLDVLARLPLWEAGLDFDHGTGHGVGSYLAVHEGPHRISKAPNNTALQPGMIVSNEPGYYLTGEYGIRIENLVLVCERGTLENGKQLLGFDTLTLAPIDRTLIDADLMTVEEVAWLDDYHQRVRDTLSDLVADDTRTWLENVTRPIKEG